MTTPTTQICTKDDGRDKYFKAFFYVLLLVVGIFYLLSCDPRVDVNRFNQEDGSFFVTLGYNLAIYSKYSVDTSVSSPELMSTHGTWPPLFPFLIAVVVKLVGLNLQSIKYLNVAIGLTNLLVVFLITSRLTSCTKNKNKPVYRIAPYATTLLLATSPAYMTFCQGTMTEVGFMLLTNSCLFFILQNKRESHNLLSGFFAALSFLYRPYGVFLFPSLAIASAAHWRQDWRRSLKKFVMLSLPLMITVCCWFWYSSHVQKSGNAGWITKRYGSTGVSFEQLTSNEGYIQILKNAHWFSLPGLGELSMPVAFDDVYKLDDTTPASVVGLLLLALSAIGAFLCLTGKSKQDRIKHASVVSWVLLGIVYLFLRATAYSQEPRYWLTYLPFLYFYAIVAALALSRKNLNPRSSKFVVLITLLLLGTTNLCSGVVLKKNPKFRSKQYFDLSYVLEMLKKELPKDALIVSEKPHISLAGTGLNSINIDDAVSKNPELVLSWEGPVYVITEVTNTEIRDQLEIEPGTRLELGGSMSVQVNRLK